MIQSFFDSKKNIKDSLHKFTLEAILLPNLNKTSFASLLKKSSLTLEKDYFDEILFFSTSAKDSLNIGKCLPSTEIKKRYEGCLIDCGCIDRVKSERQILRQIVPQLNTNG